MGKLKFDFDDKKLIEKFLDADRNINVLTDDEQKRWIIMMINSSEFAEYYHKELELRNGVNKALKEKDIVELREEINELTGRNKKRGFWNWFKKMLNLK